MTAPVRARESADPNPRRLPRCPIAVPVRVTTRKAGAPLAVPGRSINLGEGGLAAVLAGDFHPGDSVGLEFLLPELGLGLHTRAVVRHHTDLRSGFEFMGLSLEQQAMIRRWIRRNLELQAAGTTPQPTRELDKEKPTTTPAVRQKAAPSGRLLRVLLTAVLGLAVIAGTGWWAWQQGWISFAASSDTPSTATRRIKLGPGALDPLVLYKADPVYPSGAEHSSAILLLHIVVGRDGTVIEQRPMTGPEHLAAAAMEAVKEWRFQPYRLQGEPVEVETSVAVEFNPRRTATP